jgi:transposase-like protein
MIGATPKKPVETSPPGCCAGRQGAPYAGRRSIRASARGVEENIEETLTFYRLPREHHKHLRSTNMLERLNQKIKRRTHIIRIETHRYLNMEMLREQRKQLQLLDAA